MTQSACRFFPAARRWPSLHTMISTTANKIFILLPRYPPKASTTARPRKALLPFRDIRVVARINARPSRTPHTPRALAPNAAPAPTSEPCRECQELSSPR